MEKMSMLSRNQFCITQSIDAMHCQFRNIRVFQRYQTRILKGIIKVKTPTKDSAERQSNSCHCPNLTLQRYLP
jgi:hypothetical protein